MKTKWKVVSPYTGIEEDAPANAAGGGNVAGIGIDHPDRPGSGEPGVDKKKKKKHTLIDRNGNRSSKFIENIKKRAVEMAYGQGFDTAKPMADLSNRNLQSSKKKKKK